MPIPSRLARTRLSLIFAGTLTLCATAHAQSSGQNTRHTVQDSIVASGNGSTIYTGVRINGLVGATTFYNAGFYGAGAVLANVDGGWVWQYQSTLGNFSNQVYAPYDGTSTNSDGTPANVPASQLYSNHATGVGSVLAGNTNNGSTYTGTNVKDYQVGISPAASVITAAIETEINSNGTFNYDDYHQGYAFYTSVVTDGANVVNVSYNGGDTTGHYDPGIVFVDAIAAQTGATIVTSAGNNGNTGSGYDEVSGIASGYNSIVVGALAAGASDTYTSVAGFSSNGPDDYASSSNFVPEARAVVDLVAPGDDLTLAYYGGSATSSTNQFSYDNSGTSYSSPTVAGGATLLIDAGKVDYASDANAIDGRIIKAVLMNSATKLSGFNDGTSFVNGVAVTTQALDYSQGSGALNLTAAYNQYINGDHDKLASHAGGGSTIDNLGWTAGNVAVGSVNDYFFDGTLAGGSTLTATLSWFIDASYTDESTGALTESDYSSATQSRLDNLYLKLFTVNADGTLGSLIAESAADYITTQQIFFDLPSTGDYALQVDDIGSQYTDGSTTPTEYGLAWNDDGTTNALAPSASADAPEPGALALLLPLLGCGTALVASRRRQANQMDALR